MSKNNRNDFVKVTRRFFTVNEAREIGAYNIKKLEFPPDPWGTQVVLFAATVKERKQ